MQVFYMYGTRIIANILKYDVVVMGKKMAT